MTGDTRLQRYRLMGGARFVASVLHRPATL